MSGNDSRGHFARRAMRRRWLIAIAASMVALLALGASSAYAGAGS